MKRLILILTALPLAAPSLGFAELGGQLTLGGLVSDFDKESARFDEYRDKSDGLFGSGDIQWDNETSFLDASIDNPGRWDQYYDLQGGVFGIFKGEVYYDQFLHNLTYNNLSPASGIGTDLMVVPRTVPPVRAWTRFDDDVEVQTAGGKFTFDNRENPFYVKAGVDRQTKEGRMPYGMFDGTNVFYLAMPVDYTTYTSTLEGGYRSKETTVALNVGYSNFENDNDVLTLIEGGTRQEYGLPADNYAYNISGRLTQKLPMQSLLALKAAFNQHVSDVDFNKFLTTPSPTADGSFDGDIRYYRGSAVLTSQWSRMLDTRLFYDYLNRENHSDSVTSFSASDLENVTNSLFEYEKHHAGLDAGYRLNKTNKLTGGYEFTYTDRTRSDAETTYDNLVFGELKNTAIDWMTAKLRLEYLNRDSNSNFKPDELEGDDLIKAFFTPFDYASKNRYKTKLSLDFSPMERLTLGLNYAFVDDDYDATQFGLQKDLHHELYVDVGVELPAKIKLNTYAGYEYTESNFDSRRYNPGGADPTLPTTSLNYNWSEEFSYDFFAIGGKLAAPLMAKLDVVVNVDYQLVDGTIDFARAAAAGAPLGTLDHADDYYKTQAGIRTNYTFDRHWSAALGYAYERSNLTDWKYDNFTYHSGTVNLSGVGLDRDYEVNLVYVTTTYRF